MGQAPLSVGRLQETCQLLRYNEISRLDLCDRGITEQDLKALAQCLETNSSLETLNLSYNPNLKRGLLDLARCLELDNASLKNLLLGFSVRRELQHSITVALGNMLRYNTTLSMLCLDNNCMNDESATNLAVGLRDNVSLTILNLSFNRIGDEGAGAIASAMRENKHHSRLVTLLLKQNRIGNDGAAALGNMLYTNTSLQELSLQQNSGIAQEGIQALSEAMSSNYFVNQLHVDIHDNRGLYTKLKFYQALNCAGRKLLRNHIAMGMWPFILAKAGRDTEFGASLVFWFLTKDPDLWCGSNSKGDTIILQQPQWHLSLTQSPAVMQARHVYHETRSWWLEEARKREGSVYRRIPVEEQEGNGREGA